MKDPSVGPGSVGDGGSTAGKTSSKVSEPESENGGAADGRSDTTDAEARVVGGTADPGAVGVATVADPVAAPVDEEGWEVLPVDGFEIRPATADPAEEKWTLVVKTRTRSAGWTVKLRESPGTSLTMLVEYEVVGRPPQAPEAGAAAQVETPVEATLEVLLTTKTRSVILSGHDGDGSQSEVQAIPRPAPARESRETEDPASSAEGAEQ